MNKIDEKVESYIQRADKIAGFKLSKEYKTPANLWEWTKILVEVAKMIQKEELASK